MESWTWHEYGGEGDIEEKEDEEQDDDRDDDNDDDSDDDCGTVSDTALAIMTDGVLVGDGVDDVSGVDHKLCESERAKVRQPTSCVLYASRMMTSVIVDLPGKRKRTG